MTQTTTRKSGKSTAKPAPAKPSAGRAAKGVKSAVKSTATTAAKTAAKRPVGRPPATKTAPEARKPVKPAKLKKSKVVRDSFTMPEAEYALIGEVKKACLNAGFEIKKSEILRIGVAMLAKLDPKKLKAAQAALQPLKAGRPKKAK